MKKDCSNIITLMEEYQRMCKTIRNCYDCPLDEEFCDINGDYSIELGNIRDVDISKRCKSVQELINIVQQWSDDHPRCTRAEKFIERYPDSNPTELCPLSIDKNYNSKKEKESMIADYCFNIPCCNCINEYWSTEIDANE